MSLEKDTQIIALTPQLVNNTKDKLSLGEHRIEVFKTDKAKKIDLILTIVGIVAAFAGFRIAKLAGWLGVAEAAPVAGEETALLETEMFLEEEAEASESQTQELEEVAAEDALADLNDEATTLASTPSKNMIRFRSFLITATSFGPVTYRHIVEALAKGDKRDIPKYYDFLAGVLEPVHWPAAATDYVLHDVQFNDCFQTLGDWKISETNPVTRRE